MGEAKRRNAQARQLGETLRRRIAAGEFGPAGRAQNYACVLDKSARGRDLLSTLRAMDGFEGLKPLLEDPALELWEASGLFRFIVLCGGAGRPPERILVAADLARLTGEVLPRARRRIGEGGAPFGFVVAVDGEVQDAVQQALDRAPGGA